MKITRSIVLALALVFAWASAGMAVEPVQNCTKRIDSFNYLVDYSGSMMMRHQKVEEKKIVLAQLVMKRINDAMPALDYQGGLYTFAPYGYVVPQGAWSREAIDSGLAALKNNLEVFGRFTPMGNGLMDHDAVIKTMGSRAAVLLISDGLANRGVNPAEEARALYAANPNLCIHIISLADTAEGQAVLDSIAALNPCTVSVMGVDLIGNEAALEKFVTDVFCMPAVEEVVVLRGVNFAFDSSKLDATAQGILNEAARIINSHPNLQVRLLGYTDSIGSDAYNLGLSQRRADSVKAYLVEHGVSPARMIAEGMGKSFRYDNNTEEGRYMNRRCELVFIQD